MAAETMEAGRELDALVAERVMGIEVRDGSRVTCIQVWQRGVGWKDGPAGSCLVLPDPYSTDITAAWQVVEKMRERGYEVCIGLISDGVFCRIDGEPGERIGHASVDWRDGSTPLAICRAALAAVETSDGR